MFRPFSAWPALASLLLVGLASAEDIPVTAAAEPASAEQAADPAPAEQAAAPQSGGLTESQVKEITDQRLPTAQRPGFLKRHPVTMPKFSMPRPEWSSYKPSAIYVGGGLFNTMMNINAVAPTDKGVFYIRVGRFTDLNDGVAVNGGWRKPITGTSATTGYSGGVFFGHVIGDTFDSQPWNRLGAGADFSHQWVNEHTLKVLSIGVGVGEERTGAGVDKKRAKPTAFFSYSVGVKLF